MLANIVCRFVKILRSCQNSGVRYEIIRPIYKPGGLDVETNRDRDRENLDCRDVIFQTVEKISTVEMSFSKCRDRDSRSRSRQKSRFYSISHVETSFFELSRLVSTVETFFLKLSRLTFKSVEIETLDRDHVETNRDHQGYQFSFNWFRSSMGTYLGFVLIICYTLLIIISNELPR